MADSSGPHVSISAMLDACQVQSSPVWSHGEVTLIKYIPKSALGTCALHIAALLGSVVTNPGPHYLIGVQLAFIHLNVEESTKTCLQL